MKKILSILFHPLLLTLIGFLLLALLIWWVGPLVAVGRYHPLDTETARLIAIGVVLLLILLRMAWRAWRASRANQALFDGLRGQARKEAAVPLGPSASEAEVQALSQRFEQAVAVLRQARMSAAGRKSNWRDWVSLSGRQYLYQLPWYMFIGAPGSGKTTALIHSGLKFPLAEKFGTHAIKGVGGTRNCDWWFTDEAVLIDTAGRYTTQESNRDVDHAAWTGFLGLLKKSRPRQPINGVLLTISVADLLTQNAAEREAHAGALRARLAELSETLGIRFPVYVLVTKADLLAGFMDTFGELNKDDRAQVWGTTLALDHEAEPLSRGLDRELQALEKRLAEHALERMQADRDPAGRAAALGFPQQFAALRRTLGEFLEQVFTPSRFSETPMVRGVYFTSGTQEGSPIDRVMGTLARAFGLERQVLPPQQASGRSYFITRLLRDLVFEEQGLAGTNLQWSRRRHLMRLGAYAAIAVAAVGLAAAWTISYLGNRAYVDTVTAQAAAAQKQLGDINANRSTELVALLPMLDRVRQLASTPETDAADAPLSMRLGLWQGEKLDAAASLSYQRLLADWMLPRLSARIEEMARSAGPDNLEFAYEALKAYLMLHQPEHMDTDALKAWIAIDWERSLSRSIDADQRAALQRHLDALLAQGAAVRANLPYDPRLVDGLRRMLTRYTLPQRIYSRLKRQGVGENYPEFTVARAGGPNAALVFTRDSGEPLNRGVPGLFTYDSYHKAFATAIDPIARQLASEDEWVLALPAASEAGSRDPVAMERLNQDVRRLYLEDYARTWEAFINDVRLTRAADLQQAMQIARILSAPDSPLAAFLTAASRETTLGERPAGEANVVSRTTDRIRDARQDLLRIMGGDDPTRMAPVVSGRIENIVDNRFAGLRALVRPPAAGQPAPIAQTLSLINDVYMYLSATDAAIQSRTPLPPSDVPNQLRANAARMPEPVRSLLTQLGQVGSAETQQARRANLSADLHTAVSDYCKKAIGGRYPFVRSASSEVTPEDFGALFGPGGRLDDFFTRNLANDVDTSARPWAFKRQVDATATISPAGLAQFQRAATIRDVFFAGGGKTPALRLTFKPIEMDPSILQFVLDIDGQIVRYEHGPQIATSVQWPGSRGTGRVSLQLTPPPSAAAGPLSFEGPWALFRMFDRLAIEPTPQPERFVAVFDTEGRQARFEVTTSSVNNPFRLPELRSFACPENL
ncbi:type VI secretion system membrane subunit TssM [Pigmentiphaga soli]|uniref:Type VI secretion system membrane subunit TssM n=1 Tax=Pigmentiphaga soli TaxID=1007095 RepID=A0ABP8H2W6_9BURK